MASKKKIEENKNPNMVQHSKEGNSGNIALSWSSILNSEDSGGGSCKKKRKKSVSRCKASIDQHLTQRASPSLGNSLQSLKGSLESQLRRKEEWTQGFQLNRIFFEEFPIYQRETKNLKEIESEPSRPPDLYTSQIRNSVRLIPRKERLRTLESHPSPPFQNKKVCLLDGEYLFHSRRQLLLKLRWYGAKTQDYYSSRADYVICSSTFNEVMTRLSRLSSPLGNPFDTFQTAELARESSEGNEKSLRGVQIGQQVKLTEIELLELLGEDLGVAVDLMRVSELGVPQNEEQSARFKLLRPKTVWELVGNKDSVDEIYSSLLNLRLQNEDSDLLRSQGIDVSTADFEDDLSYFGEEACGLFVIISPGNVGSQICAELAALGSGYEVKVYKGSEVVEPIVKQWKKGHFFKLFDTFSPPICTIMTDCSGAIKTGDILKIKNSYYNSLTPREVAPLKGTKSGGGFALKSPRSSGNPGAIIVILEETSEPAQFLMGHCNSSTKSFECSRSYSLCKLDGGQPIRVFRLNNLTKSGVACKLFSKFRNPALLNILITQFGPNIIKTSQIMHWIHLLDSESLEAKLSCITLSYTPILFDSALEMPLLVVQKLLLNQGETSMREEIWDFCSLGSAEGQIEALSILLKVLYDVISAVLVCLEDLDTAVPGIEKLSNKCTIGYAFGFGTPEIGTGYPHTPTEIYSEFLHELTEVDSLYNQLGILSHFVFHSFYQSQGTGTATQQQEVVATCESYFASLYSISLFSLAAPLRWVRFQKKLISEKVVNLVNDKLLKYSPFNSGYDKTSTNYYSNKKQELSLSWKSAECLLLKQARSPIPKATWKTISTDSAVLQLYFKGRSDSPKIQDIVSYIPSKAPKLAIKIPELLKQNFLAG